MLLDARYVPGPISDPAACPLACYEARERICKCWCQGANHGLYTRPVAPIDERPHGCVIVSEEHMEVLAERSLADVEDLILGATATLFDALCSFLELSLSEGSTPSEIYVQLEHILSGPVEVV